MCGEREEENVMEKKRKKGSRGRGKTRNKDAHSRMRGTEKRRNSEHRTNKVKEETRGSKTSVKKTLIREPEKWTERESGEEG